MKCYKPAHLEESETNTMALEIDCTNLISLSICAAKMGNCVCGAYVTGMNSTDSGNGTQWTIPSKWHRFCFPGGDEQAEKDATTNASPGSGFPQKPPGPWRG